MIHPHCVWCIQVRSKDSQVKTHCLASSNSVIYLWPEDGLVIETETCCHLVTVNKIHIRNTSCVLTCESLLLTCIIFCTLTVLLYMHVLTSHEYIFLCWEPLWRKSSAMGKKKLVYIHMYVNLKTNLIVVVVVEVKKTKTNMTAVKSDQVNWHFINRHDGDEYSTLLWWQLVRESNCNGREKHVSKRLCPPKIPCV